MALNRTCFKQGKEILKRVRTPENLNAANQKMFESQPINPTPSASLSTELKPKGPKWFQIGTADAFVATNRRPNIMRTRLGPRWWPPDLQCITSRPQPATSSTPPNCS
ncbi:hypothetical protein TNIN_323711 [Trichonephila inaurata madagascariensis]|uniref:Uncharacterized protein n=1 Tax=Trichonephila inaurata madagascariensis TaxID=2747483 RepID=A0A8X6MCM8_9ARAC|nr:hypothetical protein TNIN_323711 [Trichonephila inaurata madagascariensis]